MKFWTAVGKLMYFESLDTSGSAVPVFTVGWRIEDEPDEWTGRFLGFKADGKNDFQGGAFVLRAAVAELMTQLELDPATTVLTTALSSGKTKANSQSVLFRTGDWIARHQKIKWSPGIFTKEKHRSLHSLSGGTTRDAEVSGKYTAGKLAGGTTVIVLDDFVTRGATLGEMHRALQVQNPDVAMIGLALAKNERAGWGRSCGKQVDNSHIPAEWDELWKSRIGK